MPDIKEDRKEIQGIILSGYQTLPEACFIIVEFTDVIKTKKWLREHTDDIQYATEQLPETPCFNLAITYQGVLTLGLGQIKGPDRIDDIEGSERGVTSGFDSAFRSGMVTSHRQRILGDNPPPKSEDPDQSRAWHWGEPNADGENINVHAVIMLYAQDRDKLAALYQEHQQKFEERGLVQVIKLDDSSSLAGNKEHFGFRDGISNPGIKGISQNTEDALEVGEFLLGYQNEYKLYAPRPLIPVEKDPLNLLPLDEENTTLRDFGRNGSYLVFRQLEQNVHGFWNTMVEKGNEHSIDPVKLATKIVGRWPNGTPLVSPKNEPQESQKRANDFDYHSDETLGAKCPMGAHIRRSNPRDSLNREENSARSKLINRRHRILRRGRPYGPPVTDWLKDDTENVDVTGILNSGKDNQKRGLHFLCFNATFNRQFEFIQDSWLNNPKFAGMYDEVDPLVGHRQRMNPTDKTNFRLPDKPVRKRIQGLPEFVIIRGGAYFFMPSRSALKYLGNLV